MAAIDPDEQMNSEWVLYCTVAVGGACARVAVDVDDKRGGPDAAAAICHLPDKTSAGPPSHFAQVQETCALPFRVRT